MGKIKYDTDAERKQALNNSKARWNRENTIKVTFSLNREYDKAMIEHLNNQSNKSIYIKELIKKDMAK